MRLTKAQRELLMALSKRSTVVRLYFAWNRQEGVSWHAYLLVGRNPSSGVDKRTLQALTEHGFIKSRGEGGIGIEGEITKEGREWLER